MTKQVKIVLCSETFEQDGYYSQKIIRDSISDWEEVSDEDFDLLRHNLFRLYRDFAEYHGLSPILLVKDDASSIFNRIKSIKENIEDEKRRIKEEKEKEAAKKADRARKKLAKIEQDERALLEQLKKKFESKE